MRSRQPESEAPLRASLRLPGCWYSVLRVDSETAVVHFGNEIGCRGDSAGELIKEVSSFPRIEFVINSDGGDTAAAFEIFDALQDRVKEATLYGRCCSAANILAQTARRVRAESSCRIMIHQPCEFVYGQAAELQCAVRRLRKLTRRFRDMLLERTRQPKRVVNSWLGVADTWLTAEAAEGFGLVHEIFSLPERPKIEPIRFHSADGGIVDYDPETETPDQKLFTDFLRAFGDITVQNREVFAAAVNQWITLHVTNSTPPHH